MAVEPSKAQNNYLTDVALKRAVEDCDVLNALVNQLDISISIGKESETVQRILDQIEACMSQLDANCAMLATIFSHKD